MGALLRKLRGALGTALTWGIGWTIIGFTSVSLYVLFRGYGNVFWDTVRPVTLLAGLSGMVSGALFSLALGTFFSRRRLSDLSPRIMALWGAVAGLVVPLGLLGVGIANNMNFGPDVAVGGAIVGIGALGALTAGGTIKLAQLGEGEANAPGRDEMLGPGE